MNHPHIPGHEPLTPDERAMAQRLARIGPHDGPSPALDTKILAAAHAAVARAPARRRRWPTGLGVAASLVVVVGLAWQMQPMLHSPPPIRGPQVSAVAIPGSSSELSADVLAPATPLQRNAPLDPPAPPAPAPARMAARAAIAAPPPSDAPPAPVAASAPAPWHFNDEAVPALMNGADTVSDAVSSSEPAAQATAASAPAPAAPPSPPAAMEMRQNRSAAAPEAFPARTTQEGAARTATAEIAAKATARDSDTNGEGERRRAAAAGAQAPSKPAARNDTTLDRIEVSGSRIAAARVPVAEDRALEPADWLQRIRERRDAGDTQDARASLALFRKAHPRIRLPADLRELSP